jgi:hypothetical protein
VGWSCRRPGCSREADVAITYDAVACQVWVDLLETAPGGAQPLCAVHAARLSPPRGWVMLDRRDRQASLMTISPPLVEQAGRRGVARRRFPRRWGEFDEPRLEFVGPDPERAASVEAPAPGRVDDVAAGPDGTPGAPAADGPVETESSPVQVDGAVDDAAGDAATVVAPDPVAPAPVAPAPVAPAPVAPARAAPARTRPDDLSALMKPKGRLLGRAFDLTGDQHSVLTGASGRVADAADTDAGPDVGAAGSDVAEADETPARDAG